MFTTEPAVGVAWPPVEPAGVPPLVDPTWVQDRLGTRGLVLLQVDADSTGYYEGHLPGALPVDGHDDLYEQARRAPVSPTHFGELLQRKGVDPDSHLVLYGQGDQTHAAYAFWLCRYYRHAKVSLMDGGVTGWLRAGGALVDEVPPVPVVGRYRSRGLDPAVRVGRDEVVARYVGAPEPTVVIDCRTPQEYAGSYQHPLDLAIEHHRVAGHVPGSRNLPSGSLLNGHNAFCPEPELRALFARAGVRDDSDVIAYCRVAERSALLWFALHELLGHPRVRHYDGGWAEYGSLIDVPVQGPSG